MTKPNEEQSPAILVHNWLGQGGEQPDDLILMLHCDGLIRLWRRDRLNGFDVLASSHLDRLAELIQAIRGSEN